MNLIKNNRNGCYIGLTKRKIKEHKENVCNGREKTAIAKIALKDNINKNYNKRIYAYCRETFVIASNSKTCNITDNFSIDKDWQQIFWKIICREEERGKCNIWKSSSSLLLKKVEECSTKSVISDAIIGIFLFYYLNESCSLLWKLI